MSCPISILVPLPDGIPHKKKELDQPSDHRGNQHLVSAKVLGMHEIWEHHVDAMAWHLKRKMMLFLPLSGKKVNRSMCQSLALFLLFCLVHTDSQRDNLLQNSSW